MTFFSIFLICSRNIESNRYLIKAISNLTKTKATELKTRKENFFGGTLLGFSNISRTLLIIKSIYLKGFLVTNAKIQETHCSKFLCAIAI